MTPKSLKSLQLKFRLSYKAISLRFALPNVEQHVRSFVKTTDIIRATFARRVTSYGNMLREADMS